MDAFMIKLFPHPRIHRSALFIDVAFFPDKKSATCVLQPIVATGDFRIYQRVAFKSAGRPLALYECTWPETASTPTPTPNGSHEYAWLSPGHMWLAQGPHAHERSLQAQVRDMQRLCNAMIGLVDEAHGKRWWSERWSKAWDEEPAGGARAPTRASKGFPSTKQLERLDEALEDAFVRVENTHRRVKVRNESGLGLCKVPTRGRGKTADGPEFRLDLL